MSVAQETVVAEERRPLRVALFSGNYNYVMDGPVRALNTLVDYLERQGHECLVFAPTVNEPAFAHKGELVSVPSLALPGKRSEYRVGLGLRGNVRRRLEAFAPNLIHIAAPDYTGYRALQFAQKRNVPVVASFHTRFDTYPRYYGAPWAERYVTNYMRKFYNQCIHVYAPSQSMVDELKSDGIGRDIRLWTRGVDGGLFSPAKRDMAWRRDVCGFNDDDVAILFVGRLVLEKGIDMFADAFSVARNAAPNIRALIVGEGPEKKTFQEKLPDAFFTGYQAGADLARAYASADVFFNPSITETFGNVTLEAMASGLPSICAEAAGSKTLIDHDRTGLLVAPNVESFAAGVAELANNEERRERFGEAARTESEAFSWDSVLSDLVDQYYEALATHRLSSNTAAGVAG
ncbi:MAG: glycosyltransferase family 1 protein [Pseudomonadota bacterium]